MDMDITWTIQNWGSGFQDKDVLNKFLLESKRAYKKELGKMELDSDDKIFFSWSSNFLHIYLVRIAHALDMKYLLVMAVQEENMSKDQITYIDKSSETDNVDFIHASDDQQKAMLFEIYGLKNVIKPEEVVKNSVYTLSVGTPPQLWTNRWIDKEMRHTKEHFSVPPIQHRFNNLGLHAQKFKIDAIIKAVNDPQFTRELEECMTVFEKEYYYPAAAGLGGIMESLLYKTLENYKRASNRILGSDPTLLDYLGVLKKFDLIDRRQSNRIRSVFTIRNSISHYNQGFAIVTDIQNMLQGIENIFTTLFLPSLEWKEAHPGQQLPEPDRQNK